MASSSPLDILFEKARRVTVECKSTRDALLDTPDEFLGRITTARQALKDAVLDSIETKVMEAAERGLSAVSLYAFNGNEFIENISILYLLKGQKPQTPKLPDGVPPPLLPELSRELAPFTLVHDWDGISGGNRLLLKWMI
jgi:hypothetical protein